MNLPRIPSTVWMWLAAAVLMLAEFLLFDRMTAQHHAHIYPRWTDQVYYLSEAYDAYEDARAHGLLHGLHTALTDPVPQGTLHDVTALLVFWLVGSSSRSAALSLNMLAFLAWQASLLFTFSRAGGSRTLGWMALGILPCLYWPWSAEAGSAVDFRLDHAAMCLLGISAAAAVLTRGFRSTAWSAGLGIALGITLIERYLTAAYVIPVLGLSAGWILCGADRRIRWLNLLLSSGIALILAGPFYWLNRASLYRYYWVGQVSGADAGARAAHFSTRESIEFLYTFAKDQQLGPAYIATFSGLTLALLAIALVSFVPRFRPRLQAQVVDWDWLFFGVVFFLIPALVLCFHKQKSNVVLGVIVPGLVLLSGWVWSVLWPRASVVMRSIPFGRFLPLLLGATALYAGGKFFVMRQLWQPHTREFLADTRRVNELSDYFFSQSLAENLPAPRMAVDQVTDAFDAPTMRVICYERKHVWMNYQMLLPTGILEVPDDEIMARLGQSDFVLLTDQMPGPGYWPYDRQMRRLYPQLKAWCEAHLHPVETFSIFGRQMSLYQQRNLP